jgi:hypothetical protein
LSAILSRSGKFEAHGRSGWTLAKGEIEFLRKADAELAETLLESGLVVENVGP